MRNQQISLKEVKTIENKILLFRRKRKRGQILTFDKTENKEIK